MSLPRLNHVTHIADHLNILAAMVKTRSRASLTDANRLLETISIRFFNALFAWDLVNLNTEQANFPAADIGDRKRRIAIQVTNEDSSDKIKHTTMKAVEHQLGTDFDRLIVFFLLPRKPRLPKTFTQPPGGPEIETWDIADLVKQLQDLPNLKALARAAKVLDEEMGSVSAPVSTSKFDISRILKYAPADLIGREVETKLLNGAWAKVCKGTKKHPRVLTFVALGGEGKTSLVAKWAVDEMLAKGWPECDTAFAWSFYRDGSDEKTGGSSDLFLKEAITFFGDEVDKRFAASNAGAFEKGKRLARLVDHRRSLLILDGLEPLQYAPTAPTPGELKDRGIAALLRALATNSRGLCVVTTRYSIPDLKAFCQTTAPEVKLLRLSRDAGVYLLKTLGVNGTVQEFKTLVEDVKGHALTLTLLGSYLREAHAGDIRKRDLVKLEEADAEEQGGHAFRVMDAYVKSLETGGKTPAENERGRRALALLRLLGLFDRPARADCLEALWKDNVIPGLTDPLIGLSEGQRNVTLTRLEEARLLTVNRDASNQLVSLDAHPLIREYFAGRLRQQPEAWRAANRRIYKHLCSTTKEGDQPTLEGLQPLYQAVVHGCQAGLQQEACDKVYKARIIKDDDHYSWKQLGAISSDLGAVACFFVTQWNHIHLGLTERAQAFLLNQTALYLLSLGRLTEALNPMRTGLEMRAKQENWMEAAINANNLSELELALGNVADAVKSGEQSVIYADRSDDLLERRDERATHADALHYAGLWTEACARFREAEQIQAERQPDYPLLYSLWGFRYCDLLLASAERAAWQIIIGRAELSLPPDILAAQQRRPTGNEIDSCRAVSQRAKQTLIWSTTVFSRGFLAIALDHLTLGRAALHEAILKGRAALPHRLSEFSSLVAPAAQRSPTDELETARCELDAAVVGLRRAADNEFIARGLLTRAWLRFLTGVRTGSESAQEDLDEAWEIAERGPMKLFLADIHLHRARLFFSERKYPWKEAKNRNGEIVSNRTPKDDLDDAEFLINACGYHRRDEELADAKRAILNT